MAALAAGCGGSDDKPSKPKVNAAQQTQQDAQAKSDARTLVTYVETCFADQGSYSSCTLAKDGTLGGTDTGLAKPAAAGRLATTTTDVGYEVTAKSESANSFVITKSDDGTMKRTCTSEGQGGCAAGGTW